VREAIQIGERIGEHNLRVGAVIGVGSLLAERVDPTAVDFAKEAIELCRAQGTAEQLLITLPTAAMIAWQVGSMDDARAFAREARPLLQDDPRIARVVLLIAMAGLALDEGDAADAERLAVAADTVGTELGVERELPLARCLLARARLELDDQAGASAAAMSAFAAADSMSLDSPFALCLETAALVGRAIGADDSELGPVIRSAAVLRERGARPAPASLQDAVRILKSTLPEAEPLPARTAAALAGEMLTRRVRA